MEKSKLIAFDFRFYSWYGEFICRHKASISSESGVLSGGGYYAIQPRVPQFPNILNVVIHIKHGRVINDLAIDFDSQQGAGIQIGSRILFATVNRAEQGWAVVFTVKVESPKDHCVFYRQSSLEHKYHHFHWPRADFYKVLPSTPPAGLYACEKSFITGEPLLRAKKRNQADKARRLFPVPVNNFPITFTDFPSVAALPLPADDLVGNEAPAIQTVGTATPWPATSSPNTYS